jgi:hypothetical protein
MICHALRLMAVRRFAKRLETDATLARKVKRHQAMLLVKGVTLTRVLFVPPHPPRRDK